ncbi:hypothetical protein ES708_17659 [subsurface metagenome]
MVFRTIKKSLSGLSIKSFSNISLKSLKQSDSKLNTNSILSKALKYFSLSFIRGFISSFFSLKSKGWVAVTKTKYTLNFSAKKWAILFSKSQ